MAKNSETNGFLSHILSVFSKKHKAGSESNPVERIETDPETGLSAAQVEERIAAGLVNVASDKGTKSVWQIISSNIFTYFNMIFIVIAVILIIEKSYNNLTFLIVITINTVIGIVQEIRAKKTLEKLTLVSAPMSVAVRDGEEVEIVSEQLVVDDVIVLSSGNQIVADGVVCDGEISVNEALVTGESDEIRKKAGDAILSGSFVVSGSCRARLDKVGEDSFVSKLS
ncbi:MAG: cation-translocating P-type ATPase, partial [Clostridia bacterium]|nr:cation-translocating P-type ATPase [Clostridia bacterium]